MRLSSILVVSILALSAPAYGQMDEESMEPAVQTSNAASTELDAAELDSAETDLERQKAIDEEVQDLKMAVLDLNRDLFILEEELLFPANTQIAVFVSMDVGEYFALDSVQLEIDGKEVGNYLYTKREVDALLRGGVHRIYTGNLKTGDHEFVAFFTGKGPSGRDYKRGANLVVAKTIGAKYVELKISDWESKQQPEFLVREWD